MQRHATIVTGLVAVSAVAIGGCSKHAYRGARPVGEPPREVTAMMNDVSAERLTEYVYTLSDFGTRHTLSDTESPDRGIGAARLWIREEMGGSNETDGRLVTAFDSYDVEPDGRRITEPVRIVNVVATLKGTMPEAANRVYYVIGHYDSRASDPNDATSDAPGANDNASGTAVVIELARVMGKQEFDSTIVFMATAGEEQGLYGARLHAQRVTEAGRDVRAVLNNDIVGDPGSPFGGSNNRQIRVLSEGLPIGLTEEDARQMRSLSSEADSESRQLARFVAETAAWHGTEVAPLLVYRPDRFLRGGDHTPFNELGHPAVRFCVVEEIYDRQHQDVRIEGETQYGDLPEYVDGKYLANVTKVNLAALAHLANAPSVPTNARIITAELTPSTTLRWDASPEPDVAGYEIVWRKTSSPMWEETWDVGNVTEATVDVSKDNHFFGVRAYDAQGYRSPVAFPAAARE